MHATAKGQTNNKEVKGKEYSNTISNMASRKYIPVTLSPLEYKLREKH